MSINLEWKVDKRAYFGESGILIDVCTANEPRPANGRPDNRLNVSIVHVIHQANINNVRCWGILCLVDRFQVNSNSNCLLA